MALSFGLRDDLVDLGRDEDGSVVYGRALYVVAEDAAGRRFAHDRVFLDREAEAGRLLVRIEAAVAAGRDLDFGHWNEVDPAYGSAAYQGLDNVGYFQARERHEAREAGEAVPFDQVCDYHFA